MNACFHLGAIVNSASMTIHIHIFVFQYFSGIYRGVECLGHSVILYMAFWGISKLYHTFILSQWPPSSALFQTHPLYFSHNETLSLCQKLQVLSPLGFSIYHFLSLDTFIFSWKTRQLPLKLHLKKNVFSDPLVKLRCLAIYPYHILYLPKITFITLNSGLFCCDVCQLDNKLPEGRDHVFLGHCFSCITWLSVWWMAVTQKIFLEGMH